MRASLTAAAVITATLLLTAILLWADPFDGINSALDAVFGAAPKWAQVTNLVHDPRIQDDTHSEHPLASFHRVTDYWQSESGKPRVVLVGNSQMFSMSLAPGERPQSARERTYPDLVAELLKRDGILSYRLAAPGLSYSEALYEIQYLLSQPALSPSAIVLQVNYQAFWNGGIRDSLLELLSDPAFHARVEELAHSGRPYADDFASALNKFQERNTAGAGEQKVAKPAGFGAGMEEFTRRELSGLTAFRRRHQDKDSFEGMLYRARLYFLRINPSNARSISGPQLTRSQAAIEAIAQSCREANVRLAIFTAPLNPAVTLYRSRDDKSRYEGFVRDVAQRHNIPMLDLERSVKGSLWGRQFNGPDPLHMGRVAHQVVAQKITPFIRDVMGGI